MTQQTIIATALSRLRGALADAAPVHRYQRALYAAGALLVAGGLMHVLVWMVDGGAWAGPVSWRKPILFGVSLGLACLTVGWVQGALPRKRVLGWLVTGAVAVGGTAEWMLITAQRWRGEASHFNDTTTLNSIIFGLMAASIGVLVIGVLVTEVWAVVRLRRPAPVVIATHVGLLLMLVGSALGSDLIARGQAELDETGRIPTEVVIGVAGSGRLAHAVALHAAQVLAVLALLLGRSAATRSGRTRLMAAAAVGMVTFASLVAAQAYAGRSMLELSAPFVLGLGASLALIMVPFAAALLGRSRTLPTAPVDRTPELAAR